MFQMLQPLFTTVIGFAITVFGCLHGLHAFPPVIVWQQVALATPSLGVVSLFIACIILAVVGIAMCVSGIRHLRWRLLRIRHVRWDDDRIAPGHHGPDEIWE